MINSLTLKKEETTFPITRKYERQNDEQYFMLGFLVLSLLSIIILTTNDGILGIVGLVISFVLTLKSKNKIIIYVVSVIFFCGVIILLFLIIMGLLMGGLVDMEDRRLP